MLKPGKKRKMIGRSRDMGRWVMTAAIAIALSLAMRLPDRGMSLVMAADTARPNILFVFADDQCYDTIKALGNSEVRTPNLDRLAREGTTFTNTYNMGSWTGAVCVASRTMLNTGRFLWRARAADLPEIARREQTWSQLLRKAGYETYMTGKWHVGGLKTQEIFDHVVNERPGMPNQTDEGYNRPVEDRPDKWSPSDPKFGGFWKGGKHWSEVLADDATAFLQRAAKRDQPFFMYLAFNAPHDPRQSPQRFVDMYPQQQIAVPRNFLPEYPYKQEIGCYQMRVTKQGKTTIKWQRDEHLAPWPRTDYAVRVNRQEYYAIITHMDEQIGRILDALDRTGERDNTYIVFTADHGLACGQHGLMGKQNMYEHSMRPPLIVVGPGVPAGQQRSAPVYLQDAMPTTLELAGIDKPNYVDFHSLLPRIRNPQQSSAYDAIYGAYQTDLQRMVRVGNWKLIVYPQAKVVRLFDLQADPAEMHDLAGDSQQKDRVRGFFNELLRLQERMDDQLDLTAHFPNLSLPHRRGKP